MNEEKDVSKALEQMDGFWWQIRAQFDNYLDAADGQVKSFKAALKVLQSYSLECTTNFAGIKDAFAASARADHQSHSVLNQVWTTVLPAVGVLTAKIEDSAYLLLFAQADVRSVNIGERFGLNTSVAWKQFCMKSNKQKAVAEKVVHAAIEEGIYGQALKQLTVMLGHLVMLEDRFMFGGLGEAPSAEALDQAVERLNVAKESVEEAIPPLAESLLKRAVSFCQ